jgi:galactose mutarotase-like enzyme
MISLSNGIFSARVAETGAELRSLMDIGSGREHIWRGDPAWWGGTAPVLFPVIGGLKNGAYSWEGRQYKMGSHGFARNSDFAVVRASEDRAELALSSSEKTRQMYPFDFSLSVSFNLERAGIAVRYDVRNTGRGPMLFSIGSHPAFAVPFAGGALENHYVLFEREENMERLYFSKEGLVDAERRGPGLEDTRLLSITRTMFDEGVMIFRGPLSREFTLRNAMNAHFITVATDGVPYLGIWSKPGGAPFLCIEPWHGIPDATNATGNLAEKEGMVRLSQRETFTTGYRIEVG